MPAARLCAACGGHADHTHHITFRSQGGTNDPENLVRLCAACHGKVHDRRMYIADGAWTMGDKSGPLRTDDEWANMDEQRFDATGDADDGEAVYDLAQSLMLAEKLGNEARFDVVAKMPSMLDAIVAKHGKREGRTIFTEAMCDALGCSAATVSRMLRVGAVDCPGFPALSQNKQIAALDACAASDEPLEFLVGMVESMPMRDFKAAYGLTKEQGEEWTCPTCGAKKRGGAKCAT